MGEWKEYKLGEIISLGNGKVRPEDIGDIPVYGGNGILGYCNSSNYDGETIIIGRVGAYCGSVYYENRPIWITDNALAVKSKKKYSTKFIYYLLKKLKLNDYAEGSSHPLITQTLLNAIDVLFIDDIEEQKSIASILSSLDDKIDLLYRENKTLEAIAEILFNKILSNKENEGTIEQLISIQNGYAFKSKNFQEHGVNGIIKIKNISEGIIDINKTDCIDIDIIQGMSSKFKVHTGDILIAMTGAEIGKLGIVPSTNKDLWLNQRVGMLIEKYPGSKYIAYLQLKSDYGQDFIENAATGSAQPNISSSAIENCGFPLLDVSVIKTLAYQLGVLYEKIIHNLGHINGLKLLRNELLIKLMDNTNL